MPISVKSKATPRPSLAVDIEKLVYGGEGLARSDGQVVLVPFVLPGERVQTAAARVKNGLLRGSKPQILQASPERITPRCEYFADCGGCHYQHAHYAFELEQKKAILRETLSRLGGLTYEDEILLVSAEPWNYRNRIQLHFAEGQSGFHKADSHDLCSITHCEISSPMLNTVVAKFHDAVKRAQWPKFLRSLELFTDETQVQLNVVDSVRPVAARFFEWCGTFIPGLVPGDLHYNAAGHSFRISRGSFFQVNRFLVDSLVETVIGNASGSYAADLYAGAGLFSLPLAKRFGRVDAVERGGSAYRDLEWNAAQAATNLRTVRGSAEEFLQATSETPDLIVADPPRAGLGKEATAELLRLRSPHLLLVSCDPATLARDLKTLLTDYRLERLTLVDLFPQTYHFETVAALAIR